MSEAYVELLDAAIQFMQDRKAAGERWVTVRPGILEQLTAPIASAPVAAPAPRAPSLRPSAPVVSVAPPVAVPPPRAAPAPMPTPEPAPAASKEAAVAQLRERVLACEKCAHLASSRKNVVFGVGDVHSPLMFVGEAPGADEDVQGEPFVGAAGQLLTRIIKAMGFSRETVYIANVLKCRPDTPGQSTGNRKPTSEEMGTCLPYLLEQIRLIQPRAIVALGATAMEGLFGRAIPISKARGHWQSLDNIPVMPTFHPSYLLRNQSPAVKRQVWEDMLQVLEKLGMSITEKQRNYFKP